MCCLLPFVTEGALRLVGGAGFLEGRLEIYHSGQWGTVCNDYFDDNNNAAIVACRSMGYRSVILHILKSIQTKKMYTDSPVNGTLGLSVATGWSL